ncbi:MAG: hypothetical protein KF721_08420 [Ignavibacteriaceae bacterium]|nr:hypothetical protein [Ignavibacteriaceae bacterium]HRI45926.1 hypothetical protein [Ignavibacteriaceae bacterium]
MAKVTKQILGQLSGKLGSLVYRQINGKTFVSVRPQKYNVTNTEESKKVKSGFRNLVRFSSFLNSIPEIKAVWGLKAVKGKRTYNKIMSHNKRLIKETSVSPNYSILPPDYSQLQITLPQLKDNIFSLSIYSYMGEVSLLVGHLVIYSFITDEFNYIKFEPNLLLTQTSSIEIPIEYRLIEMGSVIIYPGVVAYNKIGKIVAWSNSKGKIFNEYSPEA